MNHTTEVSASILIVEDSPPLGVLFREYLLAAGHQAVHVETGREGLEELRRNPYDLLLLDLTLPDIHGFEVLQFIRDQQLSVSTIVATASDSASVAIEAVRLGASDFLTKPLDANRMLVTVRNVFKQHCLENMVDRYQQQYERDQFEGLVGASPVMQGVYRILETAAPSKASIFITGESGTGKELCAEAIHKRSDRSDRPFITLNCAAIPRDLMESEIFGHVKGAFTGAHAERSGAATLADGGTLFLDELCEMDIELQGKLLRFIQTGTFQRVGSSVSKTVDIRFVCATNRDPLKEVRAGRFREDLYYRLHVIPLRLPPLRERGNDIIQIANTLLRQIAARENRQFIAFSPDAERILQTYPWPGNVRELENTLLNIVVMGTGTEITAGMLPQHLTHAFEPEPEREQIDVVSAQSNHMPNALSFAPANQKQDIRPLWLEEKDIIERAIALCDGNVPRAAALLEVSASTLYRKRQAWEQTTE